MLHIHLTLLAVFGFSPLTASNENLPLNDNAPENRGALQTIEKSKVLELLPTNVLKHRRHQLRLCLMRARTPSIAPPEGEERRQKEIKLLEIERALAQKS